MRVRRALQHGARPSRPFAHDVPERLGAFEVVELPVAVADEAERSELPVREEIFGADASDVHVVEPDVGCVARSLRQRPGVDVDDPSAFFHVIEKTTATWEFADHVVGRPAYQQVRPSRHVRIHFITKGQQVTHYFGGMTGTGFCHVVFCTKTECKTVKPRTVPLWIAGHKSNCICTVFFFYIVQPFRDQAESFFPCDRFKFIRAARADPFHRMLDPVFAVKILTVGSTFGAEGTVVWTKSFGPFDLDHFPVFHINIQPALRSRGADVADRMSDLDPCFFTWDLGTQ